LKEGGAKVAMADENRQPPPIFDDDEVENLNSAPDALSSVCIICSAATYLLAPDYLKGCVDVRGKYVT